MSEHLKAYKGFDKDLKCRGFQYEVGKTYEEDSAELCRKGFHACEAPLDVWNYYPPVDDNAQLNRFCVVDMEGVSPEKASDDSKRVSKKLTIGAEIGLPGLVKAHVEWVKEQIANESKETGNRSAATNTGDWSAATNTGDRSAATNTGYRSAATNTGDRSAAMVGAGGSVAVVTGYESKAKADIGSAICVCERGKWNGKTYPLLAIKAAIIDGDKLKPDTWYTLRNGEFVEVEE